MRYLHSEIKTIERMEIIRELREGGFDVLVGINLLREGLDIPEVSLVAILDADKEGFLRSARSLIQTIGRAARNVERPGDPLRRQGDRFDPADAGGDGASARESRPSTTESTASRRAPSRSSITSLQDSIWESDYVTVPEARASRHADSIPACTSCRGMIDGLRAEMQQAAEALEFERAADFGTGSASLEAELIRWARRPAEPRRERPSESGGSEDEYRVDSLPTEPGVYLFRGARAARSSTSGRPRTCAPAFGST